MLSRQVAAKLRAYETPFYLYDMALLRQTLESVVYESKRYGYHLHYAIKANYDEFFPIDITLDYIITGDNLTLSADKDMIVDMAAEFATLEAIDETDLAMFQMLITLVAQQIDSLEINFHLVRK